MFDAFVFAGFLVDSGRNFHFGGTSSGDHSGIGIDIFGDSETVVEVSFHFVEDVLGGASEDDGTGGGSFALDEEGEVVVADFADVEQSALCSDIGFLDLFGSVDNFGAGYSGDSDVVGFSDTADAGDVAFEEEVLGEVGYTFFGDDDIGFPLEDVVAHEGDLFHFLFEGVAHGVLGFEFHVGLTLSFFVFEGAVEKDDAGVSD